jgi:preprotein translocase subunit SecA
LVEYKNEAFGMFERLIAAIGSDIAHRIFKIQVNLQRTEDRGQRTENANIATETAISKAAKQMRTNQENSSPQPVKSSKQLGRNDPCWCGSGKKWKKCHYPNLG